MKKFLFSIVLLLITSHLSFAQSPSILTFESFTDSCTNIIGFNYVMINGNITAPNTNTHLVYHWGDGTQTTYNFNGTSTYYYGSHNYTSPGTYTVAVEMFQNNTPVDTFMQTINGFCSVIGGFAYKRNDNNCTRDPNTEPYLFSPFNIEVRKAGLPVDTIPVSGGFYKHINSADLTSVFSLHVLSAPNGTLVACPTSFYQFKFDTLNYTNFNDFIFAFDCDPNFTNFDLSVTGSGFFRPVSNSYLQIYPRSSSCNILNGIVTLNLSPKYSFVSASVTPTTVNGNTLVWNLNNMSNSNLQNIYLTLNPVGTLNLGDTVVNQLSITPTAGDVNVNNNTYTMIDSIRASFDPNEKHSSPIGDIDQGELMTYTIHFENLGNDTAFNIHVIDTLSTYLNTSTFKVVTSSHAVSSQLLNVNGTKILRFDFENIKLADASSPLHNKGFVTYEIQAKTGLALGTVIENTAHIYFDINPAIVTNTTKNRIPTIVSVPKVSDKKQLVIYPNPANDYLFVEGLQKFNDIYFVNTLGQTIKVNQSEINNEMISIQSLPIGVYYIKATINNIEYSQKFIKK